MEAALRAGGDERRVVGVIGDSTFMHSGITGLINTVYNGGSSTVLVLDNGTTAMTGHQDHPGTGVTASGEPGGRVDIMALCRAIGIRRVRDVDPYDLEALESALAEELSADEPSVIICRAACRLVDRTPIAPSVHLEIECPGCGTCFELGCPAIDQRDGMAVIDARCVLRMRPVRSGLPVLRTSQRGLRYGRSGVTSEGRPTRNVLLAGVGGHGVLALSRIVAEGALAAGFDVRKSEIHGMSQRGGSVVSEVRYGENVRSPLIPEAAADVFVSLELLEALRHLHRLRPGGLLLVNDQRITPAPTGSGPVDYPRRCHRAAT